MSKKITEFIFSKKLTAFIFVIIISLFCIFNLPSFAKTLKNFDSIPEDFTTLKNQVVLDYDFWHYKKGDLINLNGFAHNFMGQRSMNETIKLNNNKLVNINSNVNVELQSQALFELNSFLSEKETPLVFILAPFKINKFNDELPPSIEDYRNINADTFLENLRSEGLKTFDFRDKIKEEQIDHYSLFFKSDHHWTPEAGFWAFTKIAALLEDEYGIDVDKKITDFNNYQVDIYRDWFLGSLGKRTGVYYAGVDDISHIYPKFETSLRFQIPSISLDVKGSYKDVIFNYRCLEKIDYFNSDPYVLYSYGDNPLVKITNEEALNLKKLLIVKDSFSNVFHPYFSLYFKQVDVIDLRYYKDVLLKEYICANKPDYVLFLYDPAVLPDIAMFTFE